ncbi:aldose 1-epimerase [Gordonia aichiensis]|uniref:aldose epimerase family protein n=1 Tax=Gordonia aichiensis TaxID=36820 RepID=UPI003266DED8
MTRSDDIRLISDDVTVWLSPATGRLTSLVVAGHELLTGGARFGSFPMAPWCGRLGDGELTVDGQVHRFERNDPPHALHGTVRDHPWFVDQCAPDRARLTQRLEPRWPFPGEVMQEVSVRPGELTLQMRVRSDGPAFPAQVGWHPWFRRRLGDDGADRALRVDFSPAWQEKRGEDYLPTGERIAPTSPPWDDCFGMPDGVDVLLDWPDRLRMRMRSDARWVVVFDHPEDSICVEPQTGPPNGLNTTPHLVSPGHDLVATTTWTW